MTEKIENNVFIIQLKCSRCKVECALMSPNNTFDTVKEVQNKGCAFFCHNCYAIFKDNVSWAMQNNLMNANFKQANQDGTFKEVKGFVDK